MSTCPRRPRALLALTSFCAALLVVSSGHALDKQGSLRPLGRDAPQQNLVGAFSVGPAFFNPAYAARPDNTGKALMRYALHLDLQLLGAKLVFPIDINTFSDRERAGLNKFSPSELDVILGVASTWPLGPGSLELSSHFEQDRALDRRAATQNYVDLRSRYALSTTELWPELTRGPLRGALSGSFTLGWFAYNPNYFARPDNTGRALLRYNAHVEFAILEGALALALDSTFFTDRERSALRPSELDLTPEIKFSHGRYELHLAYERDMPLDRGGLVQHFAYGLGVLNFDLVQDLLAQRERAGSPAADPAISRSRAHSGPPRP